MRNIKNFALFSIIGLGLGFGLFSFGTAAYMAVRLTPECEDAILKAEKTHAVSVFKLDDIPACKK